MWPLLLCSVVALAIVCERFWTLKRRAVTPETLLEQIRPLLRDGALDEEELLYIRDDSALGRVFAAGLVNMEHGREVMRDALEEAGRHAVHELERYLNTLGTIAAITPLIGLLGTVLGMIKVFAAITEFGVGDPTILAGGISEALLTTAAGLSIGIPSLMFYRYFRGRVTELAVTMEQEALRLIELVHGQRRVDLPQGARLASAT
jgi:biopolymer transport protein ExbB